MMIKMTEDFNTLCSDGKLRSLTFDTIYSDKEGGLNHLPEKDQTRVLLAEKAIEMKMVDDVVVEVKAEAETEDVSGSQDDESPTMDVEVAKDEGSAIVDKTVDEPVSGTETKSKNQPRRERKN